MKTRLVTISGWGNYLPARCKVSRPDSPHELASSLKAAEFDKYIARGMGRSYGDSSVNPDGTVVLNQQLASILEFDPDGPSVTCESGVSIGELIEVFLPRGLFVPVSPGTRFVSVGGAIAADIHGKNHHCDGSFGNFVESFDLLTGTGDELHCSREENADAFNATLGGMGLTGVILRVRLRLIRVETGYIRTDYQKVADLEATFRAFERDDDYKYSVAWIDCLAEGKSLGRSVLIRGDHAKPVDLNVQQSRQPLVPVRRRTRTIPFYFPGFVLNSWSVKCFNSLYYMKHSTRSCLEDYNAFFYPLDAIHHWNRIYGKRGFVQYQAQFPPESGLDGTKRLLENISQSGISSFLAVLKKSGEASSGLISFLKPGYTLALDLPNTGQSLIDLTRKLDQVVLAHHGRLYLAKDSLMSRETFSTMYPDAHRFKEVLAQLDPDQRFESTQSKRVGLTES